MHAVFRRNPALRLSPIIAGALIAIGLSGCATVPPASDPDAVADYQQTNDPLEPTNRFFYKVNDGLDRVFLKPVATAYRQVVPAPIRVGIHNILDNMGSPVRFANDALEGKPGLASDTLMRFALNTTLGIGGIFDIAKTIGYPYHDTDFGLTLALWGVSEGPYLYLPLLGPSSPRDAGGEVADTVMDPFTWIGRPSPSFNYESWSRTATGALDERERLLDTVDQVKKTALDPYATFRSLYRQNRASKVEKLRAGDRPLIWDKPPASR